MKEITFLKAMRQFHQDDMLDTEKFADNFFGKDFKVISLLQELKARRESDLRPATKFLTATLDEQMVSLTEEYAEVYKAFENYTNNVVTDVSEVEDEAMYEVFAAEDAAIKDQLAEELVDLQTTCETMLAIMGLSEQQRREVRQKVIEKNLNRGYYQEKVSE